MNEAHHLSSAHKLTRARVPLSLPSRSPAAPHHIPARCLGTAERSPICLAVAPRPAHHFRAHQGCPPLPAPPTAIGAPPRPCFWLVGCFAAVACHTVALALVAACAQLPRAAGRSRYCNTAIHWHHRPISSPLILLFLDEHIATIESPRPLHSPLVAALGAKIPRLAYHRRLRELVHTGHTDPLESRRHVEPQRLCHTTLGPARFDRVIN